MVLPTPVPTVRLFQPHCSLSHSPFFPCPSPPQQDGENWRAQMAKIMGWGKNNLKKITMR